MRRRKILVISMLMMFFGMIGILTACGSSSDESSSVEAPTKTSENPQTPTGTKTSDPTSQPTNPTTSPSPGTTSSGSPTTTTSESPRTTTEVPAQKVLSSISATYSGGELNVGESVNKTDITVMARYSDSTEATVTNFTVGTYQNTQAGNVTITISYTEGDVTKTTNISVSFVVPTPVVEEYEFFYYNSENWDQVKIYAYTDSYKYAGDWPGTLMTAVSGHTGWYSAKVNKEAAVVIFNNGLSGENARQTENLTVDATKLYFNGQWGSDFSVEPPVEEKNVFYFYNKDSWASVYVYAYKQTADEAAYTYTANWPGDAMVALSGHDGWFSAEVNKKANAVIFNNGLSGNDERKTENLTVDATKLYFNESWQADFGTDVVLPNYVAKVNGEPKEVTEKAKGDNNYVFEISLTEGQILTVFKDNEALSFPQNEGEDELSSYTAAESADYTVYVNHNNKVYVSKNVVVENITVHYYNQENWDNVKVHYWGDGVDATTWPGISMTAETDHDGWFSVQIPGNVEKVVFNDGGENKTPDIALEENKLYYNGQWGADYSVLPPQVEYLTIYFYNKDNYEEVYLYSWLQDGDYTHEYSGEYPGTKMTAEKGHDGWFSLEVNALANRVIFNDGNNKKTQDLTVDKDKLYHNNGWQKGFEKEQEVSSYVVKVDKKVVEVTEKDKGNNNYVFEVELEKGAVIVVEKENEALVVKGVDSKEVTEAKSFTSSRAGIHKFFVNENNEIYILQPEIEAGTYVVKKGADEIQVEPFEKEDSGDNHLVFELELEKDDVVTILRDDNKLSFPQKQDEAPKDSFTAVRSGKHTFYVNSSDDVYVVSPQAEVEKINLYFYNSDDWKNVLVHYWGGENATDWPGVKMMAVEEHEGWFSVEMPNTEEHVLFHSGDGVQTSDLNINATKLYYKDGWQEDFEVVEPTLVVKVNDEAVEKLGKAEKSAADLFAFTLDLDIDDVVSITVGDKVVLQPEANEPFKATIKGTHTFYINKINELYVVEPEKPEATYTVELNEVVAKVTDLKIEGNVLSFELKLEIDDEVVIKADDKALAFKEFEDAKKFVAEASGKHTFYVNLEDEVYVTLPVVEKGVYKVTLNDEEKEVVDLKIDDNNLSFKITLAKGDKVVITSDDVALKFVEYDQAKSFTAGWAGAYEFYVNSNNAVYVVAPEKPEGVISVLLNDEAVENVKDLKVEGNKLAFELTLAKNDKVVILLDEEELKLPEHKNAKVFVAEVAGKHTFYVNLEYEVYVTEPVEIEDDAVYTVKINNKTYEHKALEVENDDKLNFEVLLEEGDILVILCDEEVLKFVQYNQAKSFTAEVDGKYTFYVNARNEVYVSLPEVEYLVRVNDKLVDVEDLEVKGNVLSFEIELELLDEVVVTANNKALPLGSEKDAETKFVAKVSGKHTFYVNDNEEVYVVESEKPVTEYKVLVDDEEVKITPLKDNDNNLVFELTLAKDEKVVVKGDDEALAFPSYNNIKYFKAARAGKHTFYVNKDNKVYVTEPEIPYVVLVNDEEVESEDLNVEGNKFTFKLKLEVDDVLKVSYDNKTLKDKDGNASFKATSKGTHTITVNDENVFAVKQPLVANFEIVVKKNNQVIEVEDLEDGENYLSFEIELEKDDVLAVFYGETQATNSPFTATKEGLHKVYLNKDKELYVVEPAKEFVVKVNNEVVEVTPFESGDDLLAFEIELENGDVVAITYDGAAIKDEYKHSTYTAELDGVHTFYVNENEVLYVDDAKAKVANWNGTITVDVSAIDWFGNNDAVAYIHIWYTDGSGTTWGSCPEMTKKSANVYTYASDTSKTVSGFVVIRGSKSNTYWNQTDDISFETLVAYNFILKLAESDV